MEGIFTNSEGNVFRVKGIGNMYRDRLRVLTENKWKLQGRKIPTPPTYEMTTIGDGVMIFEYNAESILTAPDPDKKAFADYLVIHNQFQEEQNSLYFKEAANCLLDNPIENQDWIDYMASMEIDIPENKMDTKVLFIQTWVMRSQEDMMDFFAQLHRLSFNVDEAAVLAAKDSFRSELQEESD